MQREMHWLISCVSLATSLNNICFSCVCAVLKVVFGWRSLCASVTERERQKKTTEYGLVTFTMLFGAVLWCTNVYLWNILYLYTYRSILDGLLIILSLSNEPLWPIGATNQVSLFIICESFILTFLDFILHFRGGLISHQEFSNICLHSTSYLIHRHSRAFPQKWHYLRLSCTLFKYGGLNSKKA